MTTFKLPVSLYDKFKIDDVIVQVCEIAFLLNYKLVPYNKSRLYNNIL